MTDNERMGTAISQLAAALDRIAGVLERSNDDAVPIVVHVDVSMDHTSQGEKLTHLTYS